MNLAPCILLPFRTGIGVKRQLVVVTVDTDIVGVLRKMPQTSQISNILYAILIRVARCIDVEGGNFENVNSTNFDP
jgi:hypothetical protein